MTNLRGHEVEQMENMAKNGREVREWGLLAGESCHMVSHG